MKTIGPVEKIVSDDTSFLKNKFSLKVDEINKKIPNIYWTRKLHKNLTKARFIIAAPNSSVKPLLKAVSVALKLIYR